MPHLIVRAYRTLFARNFFHLFNTLLYRCSLSGLGVLNYENDKVSGEVWFIKKVLKDKLNGIVFDVGANLGDYSRTVLENHPLVTLYAFEPHPKTFSMLQRNIQQYNFIPINAAASDLNGTISLYDYQSDDGSSHASLYQDVVENIHHAKSTEHKVEVVSLTEFAKNKQIKKIDLLKIDVEGNELNVLKGFSEYIDSGRIEAIHFELNEMNVYSRTYFRDFWEILPNYNFYRLIPNGMIKIATYCPLYCEIFAYQNIVALLKKK